MTYRVMLIDDNELDRYLAIRALKRVDRITDIAEFADGVEALAALDAPGAPELWGPPPSPLLLVDINMPRMTGFELLDHLSSGREALLAMMHRCTILMLTSSQHADDRRRAAEYGIVNGYIEKPVTLEKLRPYLGPGDTGVATTSD